MGSTYRPKHVSEEMSTYEKAHFGIIRFVHETLYGVFVNPREWLRETGIATGQKVLEVGSGPGFFTIPAAEIVGESGRVYALDNNPFAVEHVRLRIQRKEVRNVEVLLADATKTGLPDGSLDTVFLFGVFHAMQDQVDAVLDEIHRVLRPEGTLSIRSGVPEKQVTAAVVRTVKFRALPKKGKTLNFQTLP
jgi:ubiquinone/menaquinone biosynthesis C-methylase UbiE